MSDNSQNSREQIVRILTDLSEVERTLLSKVLKLEQENLHLKQPRVKDDILKVVREIIK